MTRDSQIYAVTEFYETHPCDGVKGSQPSMIHRFNRIIVCLFHFDYSELTYQE